MNRRGLVRAHTHWRPRKPATASAATPATSATSATPASGRQPARLRGRWLGTLVVAIAAGSLAYAVGQSAWWSGGATRGPQTPTAWLDSFTAAVVRDPGAACSTLVTAAFRTTLERDLHESCARYYSHVQAGPIRILRILESRGAAAVEVRYWPRGSYWTFVLGRQQGSGWRAVAIVPGGPLPMA